MKIFSPANTTSDSGIMDSFTVGTAVALGVVVAICISVAVFVGSIYFYRMHKGNQQCMYIDTARFDNCSGLK